MKYGHIYILHLWNIQLTSASPEENIHVAYQQNLLVISSPPVFKILKLAVLLRSYDRFSTGKVTANGLILSCTGSVFTYIRTMNCYVVVVGLYEIAPVH